MKFDKVSIEFDKVKHLEQKSNLRFSLFCKFKENLWFDSLQTLIYPNLRERTSKTVFKIEIDLIIYEKSLIKNCFTKCKSIREVMKYGHPQETDFDNLGHSTES